MDWDYYFFRMGSKRKILITNDDGITAPGIRSLVESMQKFGEVVVVAPDSPQSGMGHAITVGVPLRLKEVDIFGDVEAYECSGTPVDCVKLAVKVILKAKPDLCVSGINHGSNSSINVIYSGTMSAAMEAGIEGIPAVGFSLVQYDFQANLKPATEFCERVVEQVLEHGLPKNVLLNVNIPAGKLKGMRICRQANAKWEEEFDEREDPRGLKYYWLTGKFINFDDGEDTDEWALSNGYVSVVPVQFDLTAHTAISPIMESWQL